MNPARYVTIMFIPDGAEARRGYRIRLWVLKAVMWTLAALLVGQVFFFAFYADVLKRAALTEKLAAENEGLLRYQYKVQMLEENMNEARQIVQQIAGLAGVEYRLPELPDDSILFASMDRISVAMLNRPVGPDISWPAGLPIQGFITQDFELDDSSRFHPGIDIACAEGTPVLAVAIGTVVYADYDSTYGRLLVIQHSDSVSTLYGHNDSLLVTVGDRVSIGSRIALSGNTGQSTAPHLHYEVRVHDEPINPLDIQYEEKQH
jgi:murein DD-endopeptidase MepM/ murein hydrolase activator NlpD